MDRLIAELLSRKVPMIYRRSAILGDGWLPVTITKTGHFWRANGKIIPGNFARRLLRAAP